MQLKLGASASPSPIRCAPETMALWIRIYFPKDVYDPVSIKGL
jgi:hypothetical protein